MRPFFALAFAASLLLLPTMALPAQSLRETMRGWRVHTRSLAGMASNHARFSEVAARADLQALATAASELQAQLNASTADARDFKARFVALAASARALTPASSNFPAFRAQVAEIQSSCAACHDKYNN